MNAQQDSQSLSALIRRPVYAGRFKEILHERTDQFASSLLQVGASMPDVEPKSIIAAAMTAAALDLPINKNLGFAWIVPYEDTKRGRKLAQFQMGYKGYIQLGLRTAQYQRMNARLVNAEAFRGYDDIGEPIIDWGELDETLEPVGYAFAFRLVNGFSKLAYWPKSKVQAHAQRYSQAFRKKVGPWVTHEHEMCLKTVIKNELSKWGILSVQMEKAYREDNAVRLDDESGPLELDDFAEASEAAGREIPAPAGVPSAEASATLGTEKTAEKTAVTNAEQVTRSQSASASVPVPLATGIAGPPAAAPVSLVGSGSPPANVCTSVASSVAGDVSKPAQSVHVQTSQQADAPAPPRRRRKLDNQAEMLGMEAAPLPNEKTIVTETTLLAQGCEQNGVSFDQFRTWVISNFGDVLQNADTWEGWKNVPEVWSRRWLKAGDLLYSTIKKG